MLLVIARYTISAGHEQEVLALLPQLARQSRTEPDNLAFEALHNLEDGRSVILLERYASREALDAHRDTPHFQRLVVEQIIPRLESRVVETHDVPG